MLLALVAVAAALGAAFLWTTLQSTDQDTAGDVPEETAATESADMLSARDAALNPAPTPLEVGAGTVRSDELSQEPAHGDRLNDESTTDATAGSTTDAGTSTSSQDSVSPTEVTRAPLIVTTGSVDQATGQSQTAPTEPTTPARPAGDQASAPSNSSTKTTRTTTAQPASSEPMTTQPATTGQPTTTRPTTSTRETTTTPQTTTRPPTTRPTTSRPPAGVVWQDDFNSLDRSVWSVEHSTYGDGNNELQCYQPDNVSVRDGRLILRARSETVTCPGGSIRQVTSGMIRSRGVTFSPGQAIEFRVKLTPADPNDQGGLWPAVWASSWAGGGWPRGGELDFLEVMTAEDPRRAMFSMHFASTSGGHALRNKGVVGSNNFSDEWHVIRFDYGHNGNLVWYLDGVEAFRVTDAPTAQGWPAPFDQTISQLKLNLAVGGRPGPLAPGALGSSGATFEVDWIRIIQM